MTPGSLWIDSDGLQYPGMATWRTGLRDPQGNQEWVITQIVPGEQTHHAYQLGWEVLNSDVLLGATSSIEGTHIQGFHWVPWSGPIGSWLKRLRCWKCRETELDREAVGLRYSIESARVLSECALHFDDSPRGGAILYGRRNGYFRTVQDPPGPTVWDRLRAARDPV